jgi:uncharacterized protein
VHQLLANRALWAAVVPWLAAQIIKPLWALATTRKLNIFLIMSPGGMPSSHSALVTGLAAGIGNVYGLSSGYFAIAAVFAGVVMYDAAGVRLAVSRQARILNLMMDDFFHARGFNEHRLRELVGHTPIQVLWGAVLGGVVGWLLTR